MRSEHFDHPPLRRYAVAILSAAAASLATIGVASFLHGKAPLLFFAIAVLVSAAYGGLGPGLLVTALSIAIVELFFHPEMFLLSIPHANVILLAILGVGMSAVLGRLHTAHEALKGAKNDLESANQVLAHRTESLAQSNEELQRFAYALAHDLNTPLRGISALTELLVERNAAGLDENSKECAGMIVSGVQRMQSMIKGLLEYAAAVEKPGLQDSIDCNALVRRAIEDLGPAIEESGAQITIDPLPSVPAVEGHLLQVFSNLISNGIKYRPGVRVPHIKISATDANDEWIFCVADNGIGLDMKNASKIFGMFQRLHEGEYEGNGIGLALCKIVIERHGGRIWVESELGRGARFYFAMPKVAATRKGATELALSAGARTS